MKDSVRSEFTECSCPSVARYGATKEFNEFAWQIQFLSYVVLRSLSLVSLVIMAPPAFSSSTSVSKNTAPESRLVNASSIRYSEILSALSVALDITQGHPQGHSMRSCMIGMRLANVLKLSSEDRSALFYALLLKDLGCSSNAAKISYLFAGDDHSVKHSARLMDWTSPVQCLKHCWTNCAPEGTTIDKIVKVAKLVGAGPQTGRKISEIRCERGAEIARMLRLSNATAQAIRDLDEHWNGGGNPKQLKGNEISLLGRICGLAQCVEVYFVDSGIAAAYDVAIRRKGKWFDPQLVDALQSFRDDMEFWYELHSDDLVGNISKWEPEDTVLTADESGVDRIAEAFAQVVDAKSPWTFLHSTRVAQIAVGVAQVMGLGDGMIQDIRRVGLLHDIGKLGVSNLILDKPGRPTDEEFAQIRKHPEYSFRWLLIACMASGSSASELRPAPPIGHQDFSDLTANHTVVGPADLPLVKRDFGSPEKQASERIGVRDVFPLFSGDVSLDGVAPITDASNGFCRAMKRKIPFE
ncbi:MAG: HD domain-containing phosphohydrolase [Pirellula sp.]